MARIIGIDLGAWSVKATVLEGGFSRFEVKEQTSQLVTQPDGELPSQSAKLDALQTILTTLGADENTVMGTGYPIDNASVRLIQMPFADKNQIAQTLEFEVEGLVPYDLEDMIVAHRIVDTAVDGSSVLAAIVPKDQLRPFIHDLASVHADPKTVVIDGDLLASYGEYGTEAIIDIGHARTVVTVVRDNRTVFSRGISIAGWHLTQAIAQKAGIGFEEAESIKHRLSLATEAFAEWDDDEETQADQSQPKTLDNDFSEVVRDTLKPLFASLRTSLVGYEDASGHEIERIRITGGSSEFVGIVNLLKAEMGVPISKIVPDSVDLHSPYGHTLSHAYAERAAGISAESALEFRTDEFRYRGNMANLRMVAFACVALFIVGIVSGIGVFAYKYQESSARLVELDAQLAEAVAIATGDAAMAAAFASPDDALLALQMQTVETSGRIDLLGPIVFGVPPTVTTLSQLSASLPDPKTARVDVIDLTLTAQSINMKAMTDGYDAAANIESALAANERFKGARKGNEKKTALGISFTVTIPLGDEATGEEG